MALETRPGSSKRYYYRSVRAGRKVRKIYCGPEGCLTAISAEMMIMERTLLKRDRRSFDYDLEQVLQSVRLLITEARSVMRETLILVGYDRVNCRRLSRRPGRPRKNGTTLREHYEPRLRAVETTVASRIAADAINRLAEFWDDSDGPSRERLCGELMEEASEIAGSDPLPAEEILAITVVLSRELTEITDHYHSIMGINRKRWRMSPHPSTAEAMLICLRRRLDRVA